MILKIKSFVFIMDFGGTICMLELVAFSVSVSEVIAIYLK